MHSSIEICVASTEEGMGAEGTLEDTVAEPTVNNVEDSKMDENLDNMEFEKRDFDDENGIEEDE
jgi:predicted nucleic acid-binding protein